MALHHGPNQRPYLALIGDLIASRRSEDRANVQGHLGAIVAEQNQECRESLAADLIQTAGDEIQGLFRHPRAVVRVVQAITDRMFGAPLEQAITFGIGWGGLSTGDLPEAPSPNVALLDGPCFHRARSALLRARKRRSWAAFEGFGEQGDRVLDSLFELMGAIRSEWTATQSLYTVETRSLEVQKTVAERCRVSPSVISESLKAAHFETIRRGEDAARILLASFDPRTSPSAWTEG